jgi:hypothetical protein
MHWGDHVRLFRDKRGLAAARFLFLFVKWAAGTKEHIKRNLLNRLEYELSMMPPEFQFDKGWTDVY